MSKVILYTDGACSGNPGAGGWGYVIMCGQAKREDSGYEANTTNNRMELTAVIKGLECLKRPCEVDVYSDSAYVVNAFLNNWISSWQNKGWKTSGNKEVKNIELWQRLIELTHIHNITWHKVKGHADNQYNNRCDELATTAIKLMK